MLMEPTRPLSTSDKEPVSSKRRRSGSGVRSATRSTSPLVFSFAAAGWLQIFHFGVAKAIQDCKFDERCQNARVHFCGSSAGALASTALVLQTDFDELRDYALSCVTDCRSKPLLIGACSIREYVRVGIQRFATMSFSAKVSALHKQRDEAERLAAAAANSSSSTSSDAGLADDLMMEPPAVGAERMAGPPSKDHAPTLRSEETGHDSLPLAAGPGCRHAPPMPRALSSFRVPHALTRDGRPAHPHLKPHGASIHPTCSVRRALNTRLQVFVSVLPWCRAKVMHEFNSEEELEEALLASCCLTPLAGWPFQLKRTGEWVCDGGLTAFQPRKGDGPHIITVSPFYFTTADIKPDTFVPVWYGVYPPNESTYRELYELGYVQAVKCFVIRGLLDADVAKELLDRRVGGPRPYRCFEAARSNRPVSSTTAGGTRSSFLSVVLDVTVHAPIAYARDAILTLLFLGVFRPIVILLVYVEMLLTTAWSLLVAGYATAKGTCRKATRAWLTAAWALFRWLLVDNDDEYVDSASHHPQRAARSDDDDTASISDDGGVSGGRSDDDDATAMPLNSSSSPSTSTPHHRHNSRSQTPGLRARWRDVYEGARNLMSARVPLHLWLGGTIPVNLPRLEKFSRVYRVVRPLFYHTATPEHHPSAE